MIRFVATSSVFFSVPILQIQDIYDNPDTFDGFRFERMREKAGDSSKHKFVSLETDYLLFGHGRQSW